MTATVGILGFGAYIPITRLQRGAIHAANRWYASGSGGLAKGEKAVSSGDEDVVTMAVEAACDCLEGVDPSTVSAVRLASMTAPSNASVIRSVRPASA